MPIITELKWISWCKFPFLNIYNCILKIIKIKNNKKVLFYNKIQLRQKIPLHALINELIKKCNSAIKPQ